VWRVEFRCVGEDDRIARRNDDALNPESLARLQARLKRMDDASSTGAWTEKTLQLIASEPGVVSTRLAQRMKMERQAFKINVRKLKELGLTESLEIGYRLSPLGEAFMKLRRS
jgi:predicted transcriptional regulator